MAQMRKESESLHSTVERLQREKQEMCFEIIILFQSFFSLVRLMVDGFFLMCFSGRFESLLCSSLLATSTDLR